MEHFEASIQRILTAVGVVGVIMTYLFGLSKYLSLAATLAGLAAIGAAVTTYFLYSLQNDIENRVNSMESKLDTAFNELLREIDGADEDSYPTRTDGSGWRQVPGLRVDKEEISGVPSIAGAAAGGALGAPFGPQGAVIGAAIGALLGGGKEYSDLKDNHQKRLRDTAETAVLRMGHVGGFELTLESVEDVEVDGERFWVFTFGDHTSNRRYKVRISKEDGRVEYRPDHNQTLF